MPQELYYDENSTSFFFLEIIFGEMIFFATENLVITADGFVIIFSEGNEKGKTELVWRMFPNITAKIQNRAEAVGESSGKGSSQIKSFRKNQFTVRREALVLIS
jgi:hypothetical protein